MNNLKCLKQGFNNKYKCKRTGKEISLKQCSNCTYKEFKRFSNQIKSKPKSLHPSLQSSVKMKSKSYKLAKAEN